MLPPGDTIIIPLNWKLRLPLARFVIFITLNQLAQKGVAVLAGMIDIDCPGKIATKRWKYERLSGTQKTPQDILQFYHVLWLRSMENQNNPIQAEVLMVQSLYKWMFGVTLPRKEP